ncbi:hypothetical protein ACHAXR_006368, partial [Thalassiosira sp. AJA248-18]
MPKASKVGKFRAAAKATSRDVRSAPLTSQFLLDQKKKKKDKAINNDDAAADAVTPLPENKDEPLSRGQRKRLAKREQYLKREKMVMSSLRLQRLEEQKGKLDGLDAIREALGDALSPSSSKSMISAAKEQLSKSSSTDTTTKSKQLTCTSTNKSKKKVANTEISHMGLVLQHPSFQQNPFAAIQAHLRNSLAPEAEKLKVESEKRVQEDNVMVAKKKEERKERIRDFKFSKN